MHNIQQNIQHIEQQINRQDVLILAVSKTQAPEHIRQAFEAGLHDFGENYLQEAIKKINVLHDLNCTWHYIGSIQSKKCKKISKYFQWVHTVDRLEMARLLDEANINHQKTLNICIQISLFNEPQKGGIPAATAESLLQQIKSLQTLHIRGLMTMLPEGLSSEQQFLAYSQLAKLKDTLNHQLSLKMDTLSMGMSGDYKEAIKAGSTIIRLGTAIFGERH
jgi:pyridoxal phosphate enzyme (YggS family)